MHRRCQDCHRDDNPAYPQARKLTKCADCHAPTPDILVSFGQDRALGVAVSIRGAARGAPPFNTREMVREEFEAAGLEVGRPGNGNTLIKMELALYERTDPLVKPRSGETLLQGTCRLSMTHDGKPALDKTIQSRVLRGDDRIGAEDEIVSYLVQTACLVCLRTLEEQ